MNAKDFTGFEKFLTPSLIKIVYWIGIIFVIFSSIATILGAFTAYGNGFAQFIAGLVMLVAGLIFWRVICEGIMLSFKIYDRLTEIRDNLSQK
ncbi:DUF4282 domain-containing protein [Pseudochrobactrum sp. HB0163]|uniref:DUF4282 domain-containing protein n=1 Tax=Pseudochrobactrum sp. HB0163 TaxID=3450708 RepID=UPI003F6E1504